MIATPPPNWRKTTVRRVLRQLDRPARSGLGVITTYRDGAVTLRSNRREDGYTFSDTENGYQEICPGDLVFHALDGFAGAVGVSDSHGNGSPVYHVCEPVAGDHPAYLARLLRHLGTSGFLATQAPNVRERSVDFRNWNTFARIPLVLPPAEEQRTIASYLDRETARIDMLIEEQQQLIEMLRERRAAAAVEAFASLSGDGEGLEDAYEPIPWLPELRIKRVQMRHVCAIGTGSSDSADAADEGYPFFVRGDQPLALDHYEFETEAIITAGDGAMVGRSFHHYRGKFAAHQRVYVLRDFKGVYPRYLFWYFSTFFIRVVGDGGAQATVPSVRRPMIAGMPVPMPALDEQRRVAAFLDEQTAKIDMLIGETERFIELARERRSALITAAVTGQIDVRGVA
ncbi:restriction endonuclease subunit S [Streptomyces sp. NPDC049813]|uniref:restriction endonuclease subunit S n=1 Tax=Streptomyces sp. NPDC049813 TaxID=3365597 RepID=UPI0037BD113D